MVQTVFHDKTYYFSMFKKRFDCLPTSIFQIVFFKIEHSTG